MDPVTGLSRPQLIALGVLIPLGIVASTIATIVSERAEGDCPDETYECARLEPGEPLVIGIVDAGEPPGGWPLTEVEAVLPQSLDGHEILIDLRPAGCSPEFAAEAVRELASDPPDEPPAVLVVASGCGAAAAPMAQILSDSGITLVMLNEVGPVPTDPQYDLAAPGLDVGSLPSGPQAIGIASHLREVLTRSLAGVLRDALDAVNDVALHDGDSLLIPRTPLRDALIAGGFSPL